MIINKIKHIPAVLAVVMLTSLSACKSIPASPAQSQDGLTSEADVSAKLMEESQNTFSEKNEAEQTVEQEDPTPRTYENIIYKTADGKELGLDIYGAAAQTDKPSPVLVYLHGGSWISGSRLVSEAGQIGNVLNEIRKLGVAIVPVSYRLTSESVTYPAHIDDVCDAIRFIVKHAEEYNLDPDRIGIIGFSAGGHLALLAGFCTTEFGDDPELADIEFDIKCVIDFCGPTDFTQLTDYESDAERIYALALLQGFLGKTLYESPELYASASPIHNLDKNPDLSLLILQGKNDELVPYVQVERLFEKCAETGMDIKYIPVENATHSFMPAEKSKATNPSMKELISECIDFISEKLL